MGYKPKLNYGPHRIAKSDINALVEEKELVKGWKTTTQNGQKVYADGPHKGKRVGSIRGKGGQQSAKTKPYNPAEEGIQAAKKDAAGKNSGASSAEEAVQSKEKPEDDGVKGDFKKLSAVLNEHGGGFGAHAHEKHGPDAQNRQEMSRHDKKLWDALDQAGLSLHEKAIFYDSKRGRWAMDQIENSDFVNKQIKEFKNELSSWDKDHYKKFHDAVNGSKD